jgi:hypothetical protein
MQHLAERRRPAQQLARSLYCLEGTLLEMDNTQLASPIVRVGVIGLGFAGETHLKAYQQLPNVQVVALAGLEEDRLAGHAHYFYGFVWRTS